MLSSLMFGRPCNHLLHGLTSWRQEVLMPLYTARLSGLCRVQAGARLGQCETCTASRAPPQAAFSGVSDVRRL
jgi:hypothetical protein